MVVFIRSLFVFTIIFIYLCMSSINYLISKLQYRSFSRTLTLQTNVFKIIEESSGIVLDRTADLDFLNFFLGRDSSITIDILNQIELTADQLKIYLAARMYYYNPRLLDSIIYELLEPDVWWSANDPVCAISFNSSGQLDIINSKAAAVSASGRMVPVSSAYALNYGVHLSANASFPFFGNVDEFVYWDIVGPTTKPPVDLNDPFSFCCACIPSTSSNYWVIYNCNKSGLLRYIRIGAYLDGTTMHAIVKAKDSTGSEMVLDVTSTVDPTEVQSFNVSFDGTDFTLWINDDSSDTDTFSHIESSSMDEKFFLDNGSDEEAFTGKIFDIIISSGELSEAANEQVRTYFKTKFFLS